MIGVLTVALITDLHELSVKAPFAAQASLWVKHTNASLVIYAGDIVHNQDIHKIDGKPASCGNAIKVALSVVNTVNLPFLFTLGNHDPQGTCREAVSGALGFHRLHAGVCMSGTSSTCIHRHVLVGTLESVPGGDARTPCRGYPRSFSCPDDADLAWLESLGVLAVVTHVPPGDSQGVAVDGFVEEHPDCWRPRDRLPHGFQNVYYGHDHNNRYISRNDRRYVSLLKSGAHTTYSYGPSFGLPGITLVDFQVLNSSFVQGRSPVRQMSVRYYPSSDNSGGVSTQTPDGCLVKEPGWSAIDVVALVFACVCCTLVIFLVLHRRFFKKKKRVRFQKVPEEEEQRHREETGQDSD